MEKNCHINNTGNDEDLAEMNKKIHNSWLVGKQGFSIADFCTKYLHCDHIIRTLFGDKIIVAAADEQRTAAPRVWIAGGYLAGDCTTSSPIDIYITDFPMNYGTPITDDELNKLFITKPCQEININRIVDKTVPYFAVKSEPIQIELENGEMAAAKIFFCYESIMQIFNSFQLEACKIGFNVTDGFKFGSWYQKYNDIDKIIPDGKTPSKDFIKKYLQCKGFGNVKSSDDILRQLKATKIGNNFDTDCINITDTVKFKLSETNI